MPLPDVLKLQLNGAVQSILVVAWLLLPMMAAEFLTPSHRHQWRTLLFNLAYAPVFLFLSGVSLWYLGDVLDAHLPSNGLGLSFGDAPGWLCALLVLAYLAVFDFCYYWLHRAQHRWLLLWRFHRFHHADPVLSVSTSTRHHWIEESLRYFVIGIPLVALFGRPEQSIAWLGVLIGGYGLFIHWDVPLRLGWLGKVIVGPQFHRIHHSLEPRHFDRNFAVFFPFWDALFGTTHFPEDDEFPATGVAAVARPNALANLSPFPPQ
jgi:sterol desaturase/sphingolipid hydroxylase (fatty acid hydroxylase superfamily)